MEEILPQLESLWGQACDQEGFSFDLVCVDDTKPSQVMPLLMRADAFIISAFNGKMAGFLKVLRSSFFIETPWVFHLHNQATIGLWPLFELGVGELLTSRDLFIGTCPGDRLAIDSLFNNAQVELIPFARNSEAALEKVDGEVSELVYIGRISEQKNLHALFFAFKKLKDRGEEYSLKIYGKEDFLGSPNMGAASGNYLDYLKQLASQLGVEEQVNFVGFKDREEIQRELATDRPIFCSPSLHSDENFGMAALMAANCGCRLVLSEWGGHLNFLRELKGAAIGCRVIQSNDGPFLIESELAHSISEAFKLSTSENLDLSYFSPSSILQKMISAINAMGSSDHHLEPLKKKDLLEKLLLQRAKYKEEYPQRVFENYSDELAREFFKFYGAVDYKG